MAANFAEAPIRHLHDLPSPHGLPWLGNLLQLRPGKRMHRILERWCAELGPAFRLQLGPGQAFVCSDPELLQTVLRERPERYRRFAPIESVIAEMGANGVFSVEGEAWRPQRRLVMQALSATHFRGFFPTLQTITGRLLRRWQRAAARGETVEMTDDLVRYTVDVTTALAFGEDPNTIETTGDVIQDHLALMFPMLMTRINAPFPLWRYLKLPRDYRFDRALAAVHRHVQQMIERARRRMRDDPRETPRNLLEAMLATRDQPDSGLTDEIVSANVLTLLLAGEDTTAHTLAWTLSYMARDAALQQRMHLAAVEVLGDNGVCPSFDDVKRLDLFEATAHEATRLRPIVPLLFMEPLVDVVLGGIALPARTPLFFVLRPAMQDDRHFADAAQFRPDRFMPGHDNHAGAHDARAYAQFGAGPRVCPGRHLAHVELRLVLSMLA
ncbi:MAG TPA: cytochrome P450, partial [Albitalea sp.]|nr:cytochrome P450 [Albitalea sp.]